jgi:hypothetical protein
MHMATCSLESVSSSSSIPQQQQQAALLLPIQRVALVMLTALARVWLGPQGQGQREAAVMGIAEPFRDFMLSRALPAILRALGDGRILNARDAAAQGVLTEVAALLWTVVAVLEPHPDGAATSTSSSSSPSQTPLSPDLTVYFQKALAEAGWPPSAAQRLIDHLQTAQSAPMGAFKESFKQFMRGLLS